MLFGMGGAITNVPTPHAILDELVLEVGRGGEEREWYRVTCEDFFTIRQENEFIQHRKIHVAVAL